MARDERRIRGWAAVCSLSLALLGLGALAWSSSAARADLDLDGHRDRVFLEDGLVAVALADGDGRFLESRHYEAGPEPVDFAVGDFNGDEIPDLVVTNRSEDAGSVTVLLGRLDGPGEHSFEEAGSYPVDIDPAGLTLADRDGDGALDIDVSGDGSTVSLRGSGDGAFTLESAPEASRTTDSAPATAGRADGSPPAPLPVPALEAPRTARAGGGVLAALAPPVASPDLFDGSCPRPSFSPAPLRVAGAGLGWHLAAGDWNGDEQPEIFTVDDDGLTEVYTAQAGTFVGGPPLLDRPGTFPHYVVAEDVDRDGNLDVVVLSQGAAVNGDVQVIYGLGNGSAAPLPPPLGVGEFPEALAVADLDGDGLVDIAVTNYDSESLTLFYGQGSRTFGPPVTVDLTGFFPFGIAAGDYLEDGYNDLLVTDDSGSILLLTGNGTGFGAPSPVPGTAAAANVWIVTGYFNPGTELDAVALNFSGDAQLLLGNGDGTFAVSAAFTVPCGFIGPGGVGAGDVNGDDVLDVVASCADGEPLAVMLGTGGALGGFAPPVTYSAGQEQYGVVVEDFTADGLDDVVVGGFPGGRVLLSSPAGDGTFDEPYRPALGTDVYGARLVDLDQDTALDLVAVATADDLLVVALGNGDGTFTHNADYSVGPQPGGGVAIADFNNDTYPDVAVGDSENPIDNEIHVLLGDSGTPGTLITATPPTFGAGDTPGQMVAGDFDIDIDSNPDLAIVDEILGTVDVYRGLGTGAFISPPLSVIDPDFILDPTLARPRAIAVGSINTAAPVDTRLDLVVTYEPSGQAAYFRVLVGNGSGGFTPGVKVVIGSSVATRRVVVGLFDGDIHPDVAVSGIGPTGGFLAISSGDGLGGFSAPTLHPLAALGDGLVAANWDGAPDGQEQLAVAETSAESIAFTLTSGPAPPIFRYALDGALGELDTGDVDGDGRPDVVVVEERLNANEIAVLLNTNCLPRRLRVEGDLDVCPNPGATLPPIDVRVTDDVGSTVTDAADDVSVALLNPGAATLSGSTPVTPVLGVADFDDLSINLAGRGYRLGFTDAASVPRTARSPRFSQGLDSPPPGITGPAQVCSTDVGVAYQTAVGYDTYSWTLDAATVPSTSWKAFLSTVPAGPHGLDVTVTQDSCVAMAPQFPLSSFDPLTAVSLSVAGDTLVPLAGTGGTVTANPTGGADTFQWRYQSTGGGPVVDIGAATTDPDYMISGADFGSAGSYNLWVVVTPQQCGSTQTSASIQVDVYEISGSTTGVRALSARSLETEVTLQWVNPAGQLATWVRYTSGDPCTPPANLNEGTLLTTTGPLPGMKQGVVDAGLSSGDTLCYSVFVETAAKQFSPAAELDEVQTITNTVDIAWTFSTGAAIDPAPVGLGPGAIYFMSNDNHLHSAARGDGAGGGLWPTALPGWVPPVLDGPAGGRLTAVPFASDPMSIFVSTSDGANGYVQAIDALSGAELWKETLPGVPVLATPSGIFEEYGASPGLDLILVGTRDAGGNNQFIAMDPFAVPGTQTLWSFTTDGSDFIGEVFAQASLDYGTSRGYFTSYERTSGDRTVWCVDLETENPCMGSPSLGDIDTSPIPKSGGRLLVAPTDGTVRELDTSDGSQIWSFDPGDGVVKGFVFPDIFSDDIYFSTDNAVWCRGQFIIRFTRWQTSINNPSTPVFVSDRDEVWVGGGDGKLHVLEASSGSPAGYAAGGYDLTGDGSTNIGSPTVDVVNKFVYVGAEDGRVFAVRIP